MAKNPKVVVVGLDDGTLDLMEPWMNKGELPHFQKIRKHGSYGKLRSTVPPYNAPAWTSIVTGRTVRYIFKLRSIEPQNYPLDTYLHM